MSPAWIVAQARIAGLVLQPAIEDGAVVIDVDFPPEMLSPPEWLIAAAKSWDPVAIAEAIAEADAYAKEAAYAETFLPKARRDEEAAAKRVEEAVRAGHKGREGSQTDVQAPACPCPICKLGWCRGGCLGDEPDQGLCPGGSDTCEGHLDQPDAPDPSIQPVPSPLPSTEPKSFDERERLEDQAEWEGNWVEAACRMWKTRTGSEHPALAKGLQALVTPIRPGKHVLWACGWYLNDSSTTSPSLEALSAEIDTWADYPEGEE